MKTYKNIAKIFFGVLIAGLVAFLTGCNEIAENDAPETAVGRVAFELKADGYTLTDIKLSGTKGKKTTDFGTWATVEELKKAEILIPVGDYTFYFNCKCNGEDMSATCEETIEADETTNLVFNLKAGSITPPPSVEDNESGSNAGEGTSGGNSSGSSGGNGSSSSGDKDEEPAETIETGKKVEAAAGSDEAAYNGLYKVMDWDATKFVFTTSTSKTGVSGTFPSADEWLAATDLSTGQVAILAGCETKYNDTSKQCDYLKLKNGSGKLKFDVPIDTKYIVIYCKNANSGGTTVAMTVSLEDGSAPDKSVTVNAPNSGNYVYQQFEYTLTASDGEKSKSIIVLNTDKSSGLNIKKIRVYAEKPWNRVKKTTSAKVPASSSEVSKLYGSEEVVVDITAKPELDTTATPTGNSITIQKAEGWLNSAYVIFNDDAASYTITCDGKAVDNQLLRHYSTYKYNESSYDDGQTTWQEKTYSKVCRVDVLGLAKGDHTISITPAGKSATTIKVKVLDHDRSGYAFTGATTPGAYKADGTLKDNAIVLYVTEENKKTISYTTTKGKDSSESKTYTGFEAGNGILAEGFLKNLTVPLCIRVIGTITDKDLTFASDEGIQLKKTSDKGITLEGVGHDASFHGFGILLRESKFVEIANLGFLLFMDDGISVDTKNLNLWVHNCDIFYGGTGSDSDQAKGDGSLDTKGKSNWQTYSYNHFWDSGKCNLCGMKSETTDTYLTYHHNWYDHSDSRHPRIRTMTVHVYNNYFDGNAKYGIGVTMGSSCLAESNLFRNAHDPMMSSNQGTDAQGDGTFSGEAGGWIKAYGNVFTECNANGVKFQFTTNKDKGWEDGDADIDCYIVDKITDEVPSSLKTVKGGTTYNNFDKDRNSLHLVVEPTDAATARAMVCKFSGRNLPDFAWTFDNATEDANYGVIKELKAAVVAYKNTGLTKIGN